MNESIQSTAAFRLNVVPLRQDAERKTASTRLRLFVERDVFVARRAEGIENACVFERLDAVRNVAREIMRISGTEDSRIVACVHLHSAAQNVNDLFLRMLM